MQEKDKSDIVALIEKYGGRREKLSSIMQKSRGTRVNLLDIDLGEPIGWRIWLYENSLIKHIPYADSYGINPERAYACARGSDGLYQVNTNGVTSIGEGYLTIISDEEVGDLKKLLTEKMGGLKTLGF